MDDGDVTLAERRVAVELADWLSRALVRVLGHDADGNVGGTSHTVFLDACGALTNLGIYAAPDPQGLWTVTVPPPAVRAHVERLSPLPRSAFDAIVQSFIDFACGHEASMPDARAPFFLPDGLAAVGRAFLQAGYLVRDGEQMRWTDRIAPQMREAILWDGKGQCLAENRAVEEEAEARALLATLPGWLVDGMRRELRGRGQMAAVDHLRHRWTANGWTPIAQPEPVPLDTTPLRYLRLIPVFELMQRGEA